MTKTTCQWPDCTREDIHVRGLCTRCHMRARRAGILDTFTAPQRTCRHCDQPFTTSTKGANVYCSRACHIAWQSDRVASARIAVKVDRCCARCAGPVDTGVRNDSAYCSLTCQQAAWYEQHQYRLRAGARAWALANPEQRRAHGQARRARMMGVEAEVFTTAEIYTRDNGACWVCNEHIDTTLTWPHPKSLTLEHILPLSKGGAHTRANCSVSHALCNMRKGASITNTQLAPQATA